MTSEYRIWREQHKKEKKKPRDEKKKEVKSNNESKKRSRADGDDNGGAEGERSRKRAKTSRAGGPVRHSVRPAGLGHESAGRSGSLSALGLSLGGESGAGSGSGLSSTSRLGDEEQSLSLLRFAHGQQTVLSTIETMLACQVCYATMSSPIYQCSKNSHAICATCLDRLEVKPDNKDSAQGFSSLAGAIASLFNAGVDDFDYSGVDEVDFEDVAAFPLPMVEPLPAGSAHAGPAGAAPHADDSIAAASSSSSVVSSSGSASSASSLPLGSVPAASSGAVAAATVVSAAGPLSLSSAPEFGSDRAIAGNSSAALVSPFASLSSSLIRTVGTTSEQPRERSASTRDPLLPSAFAARSGAPPAAGARFHFSSAQVRPMQLVRAEHKSSGGTSSAGSGGRKQCPTCKDVFPLSLKDTSRNRSLETLSTLLSMPCEFTEFGCKQHTPIDAAVRAAHGTTCEFQQIDCVVQGCDWKGPPMQLCDHLVDPALALDRSKHGAGLRFIKVDRPVMPGRQVQFLHFSSSAASGTWHVVDLRMERAFKRFATMQAKESKETQQELQSKEWKQWVRQKWSKLGVTVQLDFQAKVDSDPEDDTDYTEILIPFAQRKNWLILFRMCGYDAICRLDQESMQVFLCGTLSKCQENRVHAHFGDLDNNSLLVSGTPAPIRHWTVTESFPAERAGVKSIRSSKDQLVVGIKEAGERCMTSNGILSLQLLGLRRSDTIAVSITSEK